MSKIVIFWDIDGTINVNGRVSLWSGKWLTNSVSRTEVPELFEEIPERFQEFNLRVNQTLLNSMSELGEHPEVENAWLTAWEDNACTVFSSKFNFTVGENWLSLNAPGDSFTLDPVQDKIWWKTEAVREFLTENPGTRVIWVDDLIDSDFKVESDNRKLNEDFEDRLAMIGVYSYKGVTPDSFNFIKKLATKRWQSGMFIFE